MQRQRVAICLLVTALALFPACGYTLRHRLMESFTRPPGIFVPVFDNKTDEAGAERAFTDALLRELQSRGEIVVTTREAGGMELHGTVTDIGYGATILSDPGFGGLLSYRRVPSEIGISASISLSLIDPKTKQVTWSKSFSGFRRESALLTRTYDYQAASSLGLLTQSQIESRYADIARDMMRDVYDEMVELF